MNRIHWASSKFFSIAKQGKMFASNIIRKGLSYPNFDYFVQVRMPCLWLKMKFCHKMFASKNIWRTGGIWIEFKLKTCICPKKIVWPKSSGTTLRENAILKRFTPLLARTIKEKILWITPRHGQTKIHTAPWCSLLASVEHRSIGARATWPS